MKAQLLTAAATVAVFGVLSDAQAQSYHGREAVVRSFTTVRKGPSRHYAELLQLRQGQRVRILGEDLGYYKIALPAYVRTNGQSGQYVRASSGSTVVVTTTELNVRSRPMGEVYRVARRGDELVRLGGRIGDWIEVQSWGFIAQSAVDGGAPYAYEMEADPYRLRYQDRYADLYERQDTYRYDYASRHLGEIVGRDRYGRQVYRSADGRLILSDGRPAALPLQRDTFRDPLLDLDPLRDRDGNHGLYDDPLLRGTPPYVDPRDSERFLDRRYSPSVDGIEGDYTLNSRERGLHPRVRLSIRRGTGIGDYHVSRREIHPDGQVVSSLSGIGQWDPRDRELDVVFGASGRGAIQVLTGVDRRNAYTSAVYELARSSGEVRERFQVRGQSERKANGYRDGHAQVGVSGRYVLYEYRWGSGTRITMRVEQLSNSQARVTRHERGRVYQALGDLRRQDGYQRIRVRFRGHRQLEGQVTIKVYPNGKMKVSYREDDRFGHHDHGGSTYTTEEGWLNGVPQDELRQGVGRWWHELWD